MKSINKIMIFALLVCQFTFCVPAETNKNLFYLVFFFLNQPITPAAPVETTPSTLTNSGTKDWIRQLGVAGGSTSATGITSDSSGNVYTTGYTNGSLDGQTLTTAGFNDLLIVKYDGSGNKQWTRLLGVASSTTMAYAITSDSSGNLYITGETYGNLDGQTITGTSDLFITKYDGNGTKQWTRLLGVSGNSVNARGITSDSSGNVYATGSVNDALDGQTKIGPMDLFITKYNSTGTKQWTRQFGVTGRSTNATGITNDGSGNLYVTGFTTGALDGQTLAGTQDAFVVKYDGNGTKQWTRLSGAASKSSEGRGISSDGSGNVYAIGNTNGALDGQTLTGIQDLFLVKYSSSGTKLWTRQLGVASKVTNGQGISTDSSGNVYATGYTNGTLDGQNLTGANDLFIVTYNNIGTKQWTRLLGVANKNTYGFGITKDGSGNAYASGYTDGGLDGSLSGTQDLFVVKYK